MSLKDQLLKAGLIDQSKAQKAEQEQRKQAHQKTAKAQKKAKKTGEVIVDEAKLLAEKARQNRLSAPRTQPPAARTSRTESHPGANPPTDRHEPH